MVGSLTETTDPPLTRGQGRGVNFEFVCLINVCSSSFQALNVGAMSKLQCRQSAELSDTKSFNNTKPNLSTYLSLSVTTNNLMLQGGLEEELLLLVSRLVLQSRHEHTRVQRELFVMEVNE
jgi:hypothetical protein